MGPRQTGPGTRATPRSAVGLCHPFNGRHYPSTNYENPSPHQPRAGGNARPPNQGSEVVDRLRHFKLLKQINGPACLQMGTEEKGFIQNLGKVEFDLGVIAGNRSINPLLSLLLPGEDDGKVTVERTKIEGMNDFRIVPCSH